MDNEDNTTEDGNDKKSLKNVTFIKCWKCGKVAVDAVKCLECGAFKRGGKRDNAGKKPYSKKVETEQARMRFRHRVNRSANRLFNAQLDLALGEKYMYVRKKKKDGTVYTELVTDPDIIAEYIDDDGETLNSSGEDYYYISVRGANNQAIQNLLDRAYGKAPEKIELEGKFFSAEKLEISIVEGHSNELIEGEVVDERSDSIEAESETTEGI